MKKIFYFATLLLMCGICWGCGQGESGIAKNTEDYDTAYHAKADISIKIGESLESVGEKIKDLSPERTEGENGLKYMFREDDDMEFYIYFMKTRGLKPSVLSLILLGNLTIKAR